MILPDSSAWIEDIRRTGSPVHLTLRRLLDERADIAVTEPVVMELLAGARTGREYAGTRRRLLAHRMLRVRDLVTYERASIVWRVCRAAGEPVRNTIDCLIAAVAIREGASVLAADKDFEVMARHTELRLEPVGKA